MSMYDVEVIQPKAHERMNRAEQTRCNQLDASWKRAAAKSRDYREQGNLDKSYEWEDRASDKRVNLLIYCAEIDKKYTEYPALKCEDKDTAPEPQTPSAEAEAFRVYMEADNAWAAACRMTERLLSLRMAAWDSYKKAQSDSIKALKDRQ